MGADGGVGAASRTRYARNGEASIAFEDLGGVGGSPLLLIMGMGVSRFWWPEGLVAELIDRGFHVLSYDQRDAGESTRFPHAGGGNPVVSVLRRKSAAYSAEDMTDDAVAVMDAIGWDSAHLLGASMGGQLAQRIALRHSGRVRTVTTVASLPSDASGLAAVRFVRASTVARLTRIASRVPAGRAGDIELGVAVARVLASPGYPFDEAGVRARIARDARSGARDIAAQSRQAGAKWHSGRLAELRAPTLVMHGDADPLLRPAAGKATAAAIGGARLVILPGVGHDLPAATWPQVADEVRALADRAATREQE